MKVTTQGLTIRIAVEAWLRIAQWIRLAGDYEVSGLGLVDERYDNGRLIGYDVTDVFLPAQENGRTSTELMPESVAKLLIEVEEQTGASEKLRFWWHYHPGNIGLMWSHTDDDCVDELHNGEWFVSTVFNPSMECRTRIDLYAPLRVTIDQVPTQLWSTDDDLARSCAEIYKERVTRRQVALLTRRSDKRSPFTPGLFDPLNTCNDTRRFRSADELLLAHEAMETGDMSYAEYLTLIDDCGVFDPGWFGAEADDGQPEPPENDE